MTAVAQPAKRRRHVNVAPSHADLVDAAFVIALMMCALLGFRTTFDGWGYLIAGSVGVALGVLIGHLANALRQPVIAIAAMTLVVFFLAGGAVALRNTAIAGVLPSTSTFHGLADESIQGWKDLLTTVAPVGSGGPLIVLPYLLGILGGVGGFCLARRTKPALAPAAAPFLVLVAVILLGTDTPAARFIQGTAFAVLALAWAALRGQRGQVVRRSAAGSAVRLGTSAALLAVAGIIGSVLAPQLPGFNAASRTVLRDYVTPPINLDRYPSPLSAFRQYKESYARDQVLLKVSGLPAGQPIRIATLDRYDGTVWSASNDPGPTGSSMGDTFQRIGESVRASRAGVPVTFTVTIPAGGYSGIWLPAAGELTGVTFAGPGAGVNEANVRYDLATGTGIVLNGLSAGDSYTVHAELPSTTLPAHATPASSDASLQQSADFLSGFAAKLGGHTGSALKRLTEIEQQLRDGYYSDGLKPNQVQYLPGHYQTRLHNFLDSSEIVGDDEQYAAALALMAGSSSIGIPARVVLGAVPHDGVVRGRDIRAWVQIKLADGSWRDILPQAFMPNVNKAPHIQHPQTQPNSVGQQVPPPVASHPKTSQLEAGAVNSRSTHTGKHGNGPGGVWPAWVLTVARDVGIPLLAMLLLAAALIGAKALRRRRRRTRGTPATRLARGWTEILDHARDLGSTIPVHGTRREQAIRLGIAELEQLARSADAHVFGAAAPADPHAAQYWVQVGSARRHMSRAAGLRRRLWATVNPASFLPARRHIEGTA